MDSLNNAKIFGGIGALLSLIWVIIPSAGPIIFLIGIVFIFLAVKSISGITKNEDIYKNYLYKFILSIVTFISFIGIMLIGFVAAGGMDWATSLQNIQSTDITDFATFWNYFGSIMVYLVFALVVAWLLAILGAIYLRKSYNAIAQHTNVGLFKTTGTIYFIGAITLIVLIGIPILFIAKILEIAAYFSLPDTLPTNEISKRKCPNCDRVIPEDAVICPYCSKTFES